MVYNTYAQDVSSPAQVQIMFNLLLPVVHFKDLFSLMILVLIVLCQTIETLVVLCLSVIILLVKLLSLVLCLLFVPLFLILALSICGIIDWDMYHL